MNQQYYCCGCETIAADKNDVGKQAIPGDNSYSMALGNEDHFDVTKSIVTIISEPYKTVLCRDRHRAKPISKEVIKVLWQGKELVILNCFYEIYQ